MKKLNDYNHSNMLLHLSIILHLRVNASSFPGLLPTYQWGFYWLQKITHKYQIFQSIPSVSLLGIMFFSKKNRKTIQMSLDWFKGKSTGNHGFYHEILGFPVNFPLNQWKWPEIPIGSSLSALIFGTSCRVRRAQRLTGGCSSQRRRTSSETTSQRLRGSGWGDAEGVGTHHETNRNTYHMGCSKCWDSPFFWNFGMLEYWWLFDFAGASAGAMHPSMKKCQVNYQHGI